MSTNKKMLATTLAAFVLMATSLRRSLVLADGNEGGAEGTGGPGRGSARKSHSSRAGLQR